MATHPVAGKTTTDPFAAFRSTGTTAATNESADRFLTLLVTQMKNQDPLNPLDNAQVTSQLAQINTVKGLDKLNESFAGIAAQLDAGQALQAAALVGKEVIVEGNRLALGESGATGAAVVGSASEQVAITIKDASGAVVRRLELGKQPAGIVEFAWDGKNDSGTAMKPGTYTFEATSIANGQTAAAAPLERARVDALTRTSNGFMLTLNGLGEVLLSDIRRIH
jgi:flagellar basal-body rod modification protein FlgD